ncbi:hypothetical protein JOM56_007667 [Amanita muscaria]
MSSSSLPAPNSNLPPRGAEKPFDASAKADIILRSFDSVDFFVLKTILSLASLVFDDMFSGAREGTEMNNGLPIVDLAEDSDTLYNLLLLVYPYAKDPTNTLDMYMKVGIAAQKYAMDEVLQRLRKLVERCEAIGKEPLGAFALAVHFGWVDVIKEAAWNTLAMPLCDFKGGDALICEWLQGRILWTCCNGALLADRQSMI